MGGVTDVLSLAVRPGVLMWEVFTCGKMPYSRMKNAEVVERVQRGHVLDRPKYCAKDVYEVGGVARLPLRLETVTPDT